jgi:transcriptional regulator with XRE-family HTH domain
MASMGRSRGTRERRTFGSGDPARAAFADRVRAIMEDRGLSVMETARRVRQYLPEGESISQASISHYRTGRALPRLRHLDALSLALGVSKSELINSLDANGNARLSSGPVKAPAVAEPAAGSKADQPENGPISGKSDPSPDGCLQFIDLGDRMRLRIDQVLPWSTGLQILQILRGSGATTAPNAEAAGESRSRLESPGPEV